jgi:hypothetical protein
MGSFRLSRVRTPSGRGGERMPGARRPAAAQPDVAPTLRFLRLASVFRNLSFLCRALHFHSPAGFPQIPMLESGSEGRAVNEVVFPGPDASSQTSVLRQGSPDVIQGGSSPEAATPEAALASGAAVGAKGAALRAHLEAVLKSAQFRNSKRCQALLRFIVEETLDGRGDQLKERTIGVSALGRDPGYDPGQDAVVRNVAIEVRKRLAQYYVEPSHEDGIRIELLPGSYIPEFRMAGPGPQAPEAAAAAPNPALSGLSSRGWKLAGASLALGFACAAGGFLAFGPSDFDRFWAPILSGGAVVQICIGEPTEPIYRLQGPSRNLLANRLDPNATPVAEHLSPKPVSPEDLEVITSRVLWRRDAFCAARIAGLLQAKGQAYRLRVTSEAPFSELQGSPLVMLGGFDWQNQIRQRAGVRFSVRSETVGGIQYKFINDSQNPSKKDWRFRYPETGSPTYEDYAVVTRSLLSETGKPVVSIVGASEWSTQAAGEFIVTPASVGAALRAAPSGWASRNVQIVVRTKVIQRVPGPPTAVGIHVW